MTCSMAPLRVSFWDETHASSFDARNFLHISDLIALFGICETAQNV